MPTTPKQWLKHHLVEHHGLLEDQADELWHLFEGFVQRRLRSDYPEAESAALLFDGNEGEVIGIEVYE